jgi:hypothetical protein
MTLLEALEQMDSFNDAKRAEAAEAAARLADFPAGEGFLFNLHCHSFYSCNAWGWSPTHIAYACRKSRLMATGLCDFDVLDGLEEFLRAGALFQIRAAVHLETRAYISELAGADISSPGEPGVTYIMGCGFTRVPDPKTSAGRRLTTLRRNALARNRELIARINERIPEVAINERTDLAPMTPRGVATERHIIRAYRLRGIKAFPDPQKRAAFWAPLCKTTPDKFLELEKDTPHCEEVIRSALAKRGGIGYKAPDSKAFPKAESFIRWVGDCGALPTVTWLDGTSGGEESADTLLDLLTDKGCRAVNIIPDRNWHGKTPEQAALKQRKLREMVAACQKRFLPIIIGTEMNKLGLPFADDLSLPELAPYREPFTNGMKVIIGHTLLGRYADAPFTGERALSEFPDPAKRYAFYAKVGGRPPVSAAYVRHLEDIGPERAFGFLAN